MSTPSSTTIRAVLCYLKRDGEYLLLLKTPGKFGGGLWNAPGGKIENGETADAAVIREVKEETGLLVHSLEKMGLLEFYFGPEKSRPDWTAEVFVSGDFSGSLVESVEGRLEWFEEDRLPIDQMWEDDRYWLPLLIKDSKFHGRFWFTSDMKRLLSHKIGPLSE
jgi:8-oxo-dGTP diphosphatase